MPAPGARGAGARAARMPTVLNGANEVAVAAFLAGRIGFLDIAADRRGDLCAGRVGAAGAPATSRSARDRRDARRRGEARSRDCCRQSGRCAGRSAR